MSKIHLCSCQGIDGRTDCDHPMTQEDMLCDRCRKSCPPAAIKVAQAEYDRTHSILKAHEAYEEALESLSK